jgi:hypothetical protein
MKVLVLICLLFNSCSLTNTSSRSQEDDFSAFFQSFKRSIENRSKIPIKEHLEVECFEDLSKGERLNEEDLYNKIDQVFSERIVSELKKVDSYDIDKKSSSYYVCSIGFSEWNEDIEMVDEYGFHYHFKKEDGKWYLSMISCVG